jgi:hypothetical protein
MMAILVVPLSGEVVRLLVGERRLAMLVGW